MSSIIIRQVVGQGDLAIPTTESEADAATAKLRSLLDAIQWLEYDDARVLIVNPNNDFTPEMTFLIDTFFYLGSMIPTTNSIRAALNTEFLADSDVISMGDINIDELVAGDIFYHQWPEVEWINGHAAMVKFKDNIPAGAQILLGKYTRFKPGPHYSKLVLVSPHLGKRFHSMTMLAVGQTQTSLSQWISSTTVHRDNFKARYIWPAPHGSISPVGHILGPIAPYGFSTTTRREQFLQSMLLIMEPAPCSY